LRISKTVNKVEFVLRKRAVLGILQMSAEVRMAGYRLGET